MVDAAPAVYMLVLSMCANKTTKYNTIAYVHFPFLSHRNSPFTKEQIAVQIGQLESELEVLRTFNTQTPNSTDIRTYLDELDADLQRAQLQLQDDVSLLQHLRLQCKQQQNREINREVGFQKSSFQDLCARYDEQEEKTWKSAKTYSIAYSLVEFNNLEYGEHEVAKELTARSKQVEKKLQELRNLQKRAPLGVASIETNVTIETLSEHERADGWTLFRFNSKDYNNQIDEDTDTYRAAFALGQMAGLWSSRGEATFKCTDSQVTRLVFNSDIHISGKLLKVAIDRHYVDDTLFSDPLKNLQTVMIILYSLCIHPSGLHSLTHSIFIFPIFVSH